MITITLSQPAIEEALLMYISDMGVNTTDAQITVDITAGRGPNGFTASVTMETPKSTKKAKTVISSDLIPKITKPIKEEIEEPVKSDDSSIEPSNKLVVPKSGEDITSLFD